MKLNVFSVCTAVFAVMISVNTPYAQLPSGWESDHGDWNVDGGVLKHVSSSTEDPKHAWYATDLGSDLTLQCDVLIVDWVDGEDSSRTGIGVRIAPNPDQGGRVEGINLLFHNAIGQIQFLNDHQGWGPDQTVNWTPGVWYTLTVTVSGTTVSGTLAATSDKGNPIATFSDDDFTSWNGGGKNPRPTGFVGVAGNSNTGEVWYDNFEVKVNGSTVLNEQFQSTSYVNTWELYN